MLWKNQIVFVKQQPQLRVFKQAYGLAKTGRYELVLLASMYDKDLFTTPFDRIVNYTPYRMSNSLFTRLLNKIFDRITPFRDEAHLAKIVRQIEPYVFHTFAEPNTVPATVIRNTKCPVVYDAYDYSGLRFGIDLLSKSQREAERFALENTSGIVTKFTQQVSDFYGSLGYRIASPSLEFRDYCLPEFCAGLPKNDVPSGGEIHLVYAGVVVPSHLPSKREKPDQIIRVASRLVGSNMSFHIYANPWQFGGKEHYQDYLDLERETGKLVFHDSLKVPELQEEISRYHYGCHLHDFSGTLYTTPFVETSIGNKFFTYLEAGLPVIVGSNLKLNAKIAAETGVGVIIDLEDLERLHERLQNVDYAHLKENVVKARTGSLNMDNNIHRLEQFYSDLA